MRSNWIAQKFTNLSLKGKLITMFLVVGLIPCLTATFTLTQRAGAAIDSGVSEASLALEAQAFEQLVTSRDVKRAAVERYFSDIRNQIITFSEDRMVVEAMRDFKSTFNVYNKERGFKPSDLRRMKSELRTYYDGPFSAEYRIQNSGQAAPTTRMLAPLDSDSIGLQYDFITSNLHPLGSKHLLDDPGNGTSYGALHRTVHPVIRSYLEKFGYYDIFLVAPDTGDIVYSVFKELDYTTSLSQGPYASTNFGRTFQEAKQVGSSDEVVLVDYESYTPSYEAPASFIGSPIYDGNELLGVAIFQMPIDRLNSIMGLRAGLGETGETYLVGAEGLMRSDSFRDPEGRSVNASFRNPANGQVEGEAVQNALSGESGASRTQNYMGEDVLRAYVPVELGAFRWALVADRGQEESFAAIATMRQAGSRSRSALLLLGALTLALAAVCVVLIAVFVANIVSRPIVGAVSVLEEMAKGKLDGHLEVNGNDEIAAMSRAVNTASKSMSQAMEKIAGGANRLTEASEGLNTMSNELTNAAASTAEQVQGAEESSQEVSQALQTMSAAAEEMKASITEIARTSSDAADVAKKAVTRTDAVNEVIERLTTSSSEIGGVVKMITSIAQQTNLLALNATIEAARAGSAGRGFGVVANEVKELAAETARATDEISRKIETIQQETVRSTEAITEVSQIVSEINESQDTIAAAVHEQTATTSEIARGVQFASDGTSSISGRMSGVAETARGTADGATSAGASAEHVSQVASELQEVVARFRF